MRTDTRRCLDRGKCQERAFARAGPCAGNPRHAGRLDVLSALLFQQLGFEAIQCTSGGIAAALGYPDGEIMSRDRFVEITASFADAVSVPVNADGEHGYGDDQCVKDNGARVNRAGVAGMNLEDSTAKRRPGLVDLASSCEKLTPSWTPSTKSAASFSSTLAWMHFTSLPTIQKRRSTKQSAGAMPTRRRVATASFT